MKKLALPLLCLTALALSLIYGLVAQAQNVTNPAPVAGSGAYNSSPPTCTAGQFCFIQTDANGNLKTTVSGGGGAITIADGADVAEGAVADAVATAGGTGTVSAKLRNLTDGVRGAPNVTLADCSGSITLGGTAQTAFGAAATRRGFTIANIDTTEVLWISFTTTAAASGTGSYPLAPATETTFAGLASFTSPMGMGINTALSVVGATTAHKFSCTVW